MIMGETNGLVKFVVDARTDEILGLHIAGPRATDLIAEGALAIRLEATLDEIATTIHAHPTVAESLLEAAHAAHHRAIHLHG
ncbi:Dihydrolipoyl dehydrogenase [compost metagenome]